MSSKIEKVSDFILEAHERGSTFYNLEKDMKPEDKMKATFYSFLGVVITFILIVLSKLL